MRSPDLSGNGGAAATLLSSTNGTRRIKNWTGRHTIIFRDGQTNAGIALLRSPQGRAAGLKVFVSNPADPQVLRDDQVGDSNIIVRPTTGTATAGLESDQVTLLQKWAQDPSSPILALRLEKVRQISVYTIAQPSGTLASGAWDGMDIELVRGELAKTKGDFSPEVISSAAAFNFDESKLTWGLQVTNVMASPFSGRGVKVAVLDTGFDFDRDSAGNIKFHPDFNGRTIRHASFVEGVEVAKDDNGHGTHCIGTACGPRKLPTLRGYGVAYEADIFAGKVLNHEGRGADGWILDGIEWAINQKCRVISLSLGAARNVDDPFSEDYEEVAERALKAGTVIIAAGGNDSRRPFLIQPVSGPADCPSIIAVAALTPQLRVASFSNAGLNSSGGEINVAAPGVDVFSSFLNGGHERLHGTSMATPHVAGIAALLAQANPSATGQQLKDLVVKSVKSLSLSEQDIGSGLIQAPLTAGPSSLNRRDPRLLSGVGAEQTSPVTIGGGGSVGVCFKLADYIAQPSQPGAPTRFVSPFRIEKLRLIDKFGGSQDRTPSTVDCRIMVHCEDFDPQGNPIPNSDSPIIIHGNPLTVELNTADYEFDLPPGGDHLMYFKLSRRITGTVDVFEGAATEPTDQHPVPTEGRCIVDILNML
jgi:hypothetical protein